MWIEAKFIEHSVEGNWQDKLKINPTELSKICDTYSKNKEASKLLNEAITSSVNDIITKIDQTIKVWENDKSWNIKMNDEQEKKFLNEIFTKIDSLINKDFIDRWKIILSAKWVIREFDETIDSKLVLSAKESNNDYLGVFNEKVKMWLTDLANRFKSSHGGFVNFTKYRITVFLLQYKMDLIDLIHQSTILMYLDYLLHILTYEYRYDWFPQ